MATRITVKGQVTIPKQVRQALRLSAGDSVDFERNAAGEFVLRKAQVAAAEGCRSRALHPRNQAQMRQRAAALLALLRGLD